MIEFGPFRYDTQARLLYRGDEEIALPMRVVAVLESFLKRPGQIVQKDDILASAWEGAFVGEDSLTQAVSQLRSALGDDPHRPTYIQTIPKRGYRFIAEVSARLPSKGPIPDPQDIERHPRAATPRADPPALSTFAPGTAIGKYELVGQIGSGAMGEVWHARDPELQRDVAIKVIPKQLAGDPAVVQRFQREALMLAAVNHPNIATIHGVEEVNGRRIIVMELLQGVTLQQRLGEGALPVEEALAIALQIARALQGAHDESIVHRDLKPANIMIGVVNHVKVLDFGLAKKATPGKGDASLLTTNGLVVGTAAYMSPEQAAGKPIDKRSDIFSFGCLLFEMLAGQRPFVGEGVSETVAAILRDEPDWNVLPSSTPASVRWLLERCLKKDREDRLHEIGVAITEIEQALQEASSPTEAPGRESIRAPARRFWVSWSVAAGIVVAAVAVWFGLGGPEDPAAPEFVALTFDGGEKASPTLRAGECDLVAFDWGGPAGDNWDIYVKQIGRGTGSVRLTDDPADDMMPTWSPGGNELAFVRVTAGGEVSIHTIPWLGGESTKLIDVEGPFSGSDYPPLVSLSWSPDGRYLAYSQRSSLAEPSRIMLYDFETRLSRPLTTPYRAAVAREPADGSAPDAFAEGAAPGDLEPSFSPDGRRIAFARHRLRYGGCDIWLQDVDGDEPARQLTFENWAGCRDISWMPDGEELLVSAGTFQNFRTFRVSLDDGGSAPAEWLGPNQVAGDVCGSRLVFERRDIQPRDIWQAPGRLADDAGALARPLIESPAADVMPTFSRDGEQIAFRSTITGKNQIWVANRDGTNLHQVTYQEFGARQPTWSPDGEWIAFASEDGGSLNVWVVNLGTRRLEQITNSVADDLPGAFSPDGHHIYVESLRTGEWQIFSVPFPGGELEYEAERVTPDGGAMAIPSPDGHYLYYYKPRTVFRLPLPVGSGAEQAVLPGMNINLVAWDVAKNGIYFRPWGPDAEGVYRVNYLDFESDRTTEVFRTEVRFHGLRVSPDETTLIFDGPWVSPGIELVLIENFR